MRCGWVNAFQKNNKICTVMPSRGVCGEEWNLAILLMWCGRKETWSCRWRSEARWQGVWLLHTIISSQSCPVASLFIILFSPRLDINQDGFIASRFPGCRVLRREYVNQVEFIPKKRGIFSCMKYSWEIPVIVCEVFRVESWSCFGGEHLCQRYHAMEILNPRLLLQWCK